MEDLRWLQFLYPDDLYLTADMKATFSSTKSTAEEPVVVEKVPEVELPPVVQPIEKIAIPKIEKVLEPSKIRVLVVLPVLELSEAETALFKNIFYNPKALALKEQEVKQIVIADYDKWKGEFVVSFGVALPDCKASFYEPFKGTNAKFLMADSLIKINSEVELKKKLWTSLQAQFGK